MLGIEDYGSDSDSSRPNSPQPPPRRSGSSTLQSANVKPQRAPKKITISLPTISASKSDDDKDVETERPPKKRKTGAGVSSLLSMLPTPKETNPIPKTQRVLGGGSGPALNFNSSSRGREGNPESHESTVEVDHTTPTSYSETITEDTQLSAAMLFRPTHLAKGKKNISLEESNVNQPIRTISQPGSQSGPKPAPVSDFFSFSSLNATTSSTQTSTATMNAASSSSILSTFSSAPTFLTFEPPEPTPTDPYPGYYQLPSGAWAAHDPEYYGKFMKKWEREYNAHVRALEKGDIKGFEGLQNADVEEIDALKEMEKAKKEIQEREEKKAITAGAGGGPVAPKMNINASKTSGVARSRHQLSTLLKEAYENREALEERIAQGKRNRKEAGNKYGF